jgi:hypothetical protein
MEQFGKGKATLCIPNYKTPVLTKLCLRSIRKFTQYPYEVIVVDNDSADESLEYLRSLGWIRLIERPHKAGEPRGSFDEGSALDLGLAKRDTEFYVVMHSDTIVTRAGWLGELICYFEDDAGIACVGTGKLELTPQWLQWLKKITDVKALKRRILGSAAEKAKARYHNRSICCLYRTEILKKEGLSFLKGRELSLTTGQGLYFDLLDRSYRTVELKPSLMLQYVTHLTHATQAVNPEEFTIGPRDRRRYNKHMRRLTASGLMNELLNDDSLDT